PDRVMGQRRHLPPSIYLLMFSEDGGAGGKGGDPNFRFHPAGAFLSGKNKNRRAPVFVCGEKSHKPDEGRAVTGGVGSCLKRAACLCRPAIRCRSRRSGPACCNVWPRSSDSGRLDTVC